LCASSVSGNRVTVANLTTVVSINGQGLVGSNFSTRFSHSLQHIIRLPPKALTAQPMSGASARVLALKPVNFEWISSGDRVDGFLAHEVQGVVPGAVSGS
jgi:hypothetical protein